MDNRVYQPDDIKKILERAARLQQSATEADTQGGLTLAELQDVASSSGIDPTFIQQAALELSLPVGADDSSTSTHLLIERIVPGELTDDRWTAVLIELRRRFKIDGDDSSERIETHGSTRCWQHVEDEEVNTQVYLTPRQGMLHIKMSQKIAWGDRLMESTVWSLVAAVVLGSIVASQGDTFLFSLLSYVITFMLAFPAIYGFDTRWRNSKKRDFDLLADTLARTVSTTSSAPAAKVARSKPAVRPELQIEDTDELPAPESRASGVRRRTTGG
jgi:hypothetical protein